MKVIIPNKLCVGDEIRVVSPSRSLSIISEEVKEFAVKKLNELGFKVSFSKNCSVIDEFNSSPIKSRVNDIHEAFLDKNVKGVLTTIGGFNANQLLPYLDFDLITNNPKIFCGYSDATVLLNAIYKKCQLMTYYGPHFSTFGVKKENEYTVNYFVKTLVDSKPLLIDKSKEWSDDEWYINQDNRVFEYNTGYKIINHGAAKGVLIGGNLDTFNLLQGTEYFPNNDKQIVLFIEEDNIANEYIDVEFDRNIESLFQSYGNRISGILIGRFQKNEKMSLTKLQKIMENKQIYTKTIPIIYGFDFGHTLPMVTIPIGGEININTKPLKITLTIH